METFLRRAEAGEYLTSRYRFGSTKTLQKMATVGGGPAYRKAGRIVLYDKAELDRWALARMGSLRSSTSDIAVGEISPAKAK